VLLACSFNFVPQSSVVPIFYEVQGHVMEPLGFTADDDGQTDSN
jgi:hypothetical protein